MKHHTILAFSLVELSIVLVILGLLTGGILAGQNMIRAAELRAVVTELDRYTSAIHSFRSKYLALPGDMSNATDFWGAMTSGSCPHATGGTGTQTCNGNADGKIENTSGVASQSNERLLIWQHLANSGMIEGTYTGIAGSNGASDHDLGINHPVSKLSNAGWAAHHNGSPSGDTGYFDGDYGNVLRIGAPATGDSAPNTPILLPEEAWGIDKKVDDGLPAMGKVTIRNRLNCTVKADNSAITTSAGDAALKDAKDNLAARSQYCAPVFSHMF